MVEEASGVITTYSAVTSYSTWVLTSRVGGPTTSTLVTTVVTTLVRQIENDFNNRKNRMMGGPYVSVIGLFSSGKMVCIIKNLMDVNVVKGVINVDIVYMGGSTPENFVVKIQRLPVEFGQIPVGQVITVTKSYTPEYYYTSDSPPIAILSTADITYTGAGVTAVSASTYTLTLPTETQTRTYVDAYTMTRTFTIEEALLTGTSTIWLLLIVGGAVVLAVLLLTKKMKQTVVASSSSQQVSKPRVCSSCGNKMESDEDFCPNCGRKWE